MKCLRKITSLILVAVTLFIHPLQVLAANNSKYIKEVRVSYGETEEEAKSWLKQNGYTVLEQNLNAGTGKKCVYLGYKTTTNVKEAITDISIMDMKGGYSFGAYEAMLKEREQEIKATIDYFKIIIKEFVDNYNVKKTAAVTAYDLLNVFVEDDSKLPLGAFLSTYKDDTEQLTKLLMQGNSEISIYTYYMLAMGCTDNSEEGNWLYQFSEADPYDYYDPADYDELARSIFLNWDNLRNTLLEYDTIIEGVEQYGSIEEYMNNISEDEVSSVTDALVLHDILESYEYDGESMLEFFLKNPDDMDISELYPLVSVMTAAELECARNLGLTTMIKFAAGSEQTVKEYEQKFNAIIEEVGARDIYSVYTGVDRSLFEGGVALTNDAMRESASNADNSWIKGNLNPQTEKLVHIIAGSTFAAGAVIAGTLQGVSTVITKNAAAYSAALDAWELANNGTWHMWAQNRMYANAARCTKIAGGVALVALGVTLIIEAILLGAKLYNYYHPDYTDIPRVIVDQAIDKNEEYVYTNYYVALDQDGRYADLNAWGAKQWNALYTTTDINAGAPITADMLARTGNGADEDGYMSIHYFGASNAFNLNTHCYKDKVNGIYLYAKQDNSVVLTASAFSTSMRILYIGVGLLLGLAFGSLSTVAVKKKCKNKVLVN